jgi:hypothetical protein
MKKAHLLGKKSVLAIEANLQLLPSFKCSASVSLIPSDLAARNSANLLAGAEASGCELSGPYLAKTRL